MKKFLKLLFACVVIAAMVKIVNIKIMAAEDDFKYIEVGSLSEFDNYVSTGEPTCLLSDETVTRTFKITVDEPGYMIIERFYVQDGHQDPYGYYSVDRANGNTTGLNGVYGEFTTSILTSNKLNALSPVYNRTNGLESTIYSHKQRKIFYLDAGTYYFEDKNEAYEFPGDSMYFTYYQDNNTDILLFSAFLPGSSLCAVDDIKYNDDYTEAHVSFEYIPGDVESVKFAYSKKNSKDVLSSTAWDQEYRQSSYGTTKSAKEFLDAGIDLTQNGDYTIYFKSAGADYRDYPVCINFSIDKIGVKIEAKSIKLNKKKASLNVGKTITLKPTLKPENVTDATVTWKSSNKKVATVDKNGKVTAKKKGTCVITATTSNGKKAKCKITVKK